MSPETRKALAAMKKAAAAQMQARHTPEELAEMGRRQEAALARVRARVKARGAAKR